MIRCSVRIPVKASLVGAHYTVERLWGFGFRAGTRPAPIGEKTVCLVLVLLKAAPCTNK